MTIALAILTDPDAVFCISCGQPDEDELHDSAACPAAGGGIKACDHLDARLITVGGSKAVGCLDCIRIITPAGWPGADQLSRHQRERIVKARPTRNGTWRINASHPTLSVLRRLGLVRLGDLLNPTGEALRRALIAEDGE